MYCNNSPLLIQIEQFYQKNFNVQSCNYKQKPLYTSTKDDSDENCLVVPYATFFRNDYNV